jgi:hypothetical protein
LREEIYENKGVFHKNRTVDIKRLEICFKQDFPSLVSVMADKTDEQSQESFVLRSQQTHGKH